MNMMSRRENLGASERLEGPESTSILVLKLCRVYKKVTRKLCTLLYK
jgi:hypothetical protein